MLANFRDNGALVMEFGMFDDGEDSEHNDIYHLGDIRRFCFGNDSICQSLITSANIYRQ